MANRDIFGSRSATFGGAFSADDAFIQFPVKDSSGRATAAEIPLLLQNASFNYQQEITRLYELTSSNIYYVRGRSQGTGQLSQVLGPAKLSQNFLRKYGSVCNAADNILHFSMLAGCRSDGDAVASGFGGTSSGRSWSDSHSFTAKFVVINSIGLQMAAQSMIIQQTIGMTTSAMEYGDPEFDRSAVAAANAVAAAATAAAGAAVGVGVA